MTTVDSHLPAPNEAGRFRAGPVDVRADRILRIQGYRDMGRVRRPIRRRRRRRRRSPVRSSRARWVTGGFAIAACNGSVLELVWNKTVPRPSTALTGAPAIPRSGIAKRPHQRSPLEGGERFECGAFERFLAECESVVVFAMTTGAAIDRRIDELMAADDPVVALLLDTAGWLAVESVTRQFSERLKADCEQAGLRLTRRMGPGYTYRVGREMAPWGLEEQAGLFSVLGEDASPVTVLESGAMLPKMSRSGLYGLRAAGSARPAA